LVHRVECDRGQVEAIGHRQQCSPDRDRHLADACAGADGHQQQQAGKQEKQAEAGLFSKMALERCH
jgi:hypothetical protein